MLYKIDIVKLKWVNNSDKRKKKIFKKQFSNIDYIKLSDI